MINMCVGIDWGSVADWVSGLGTAGALLWGIVLYLQNRRTHEEALARALTARTSSTIGIDCAEEIYIHNSGAKPVMWVRSFAFMSDGSTFRLEQQDPPPAKDEYPGQVDSIEPGETVRMGYAWSSEDGGPTCLLHCIEFTDGDGRMWINTVTFQHLVRADANYTRPPARKYRKQLKEAKRLGFTTPQPAG